jgi:hypothetical protein
MNKPQTRPILGTLLLYASLAACGSGSVGTLPGTGSVGTAGGASGSGRIVHPDAFGAAYVALGHAGNFAILAGSTVTNSGPTVVKGISDAAAPCGSLCGYVGIWPGTALTGFPPGEIDGNFYGGVPYAQRAQGDATTAYNSAMGQVLKPILVSGNLGGKTLTPGLYKSTNSLTVSSGDLTLDGQGRTNSNWVFQVASTFSMTTGRRIILTNGASAGNVLWAVGSSATLGTGAVCYGNIIAYQSISLGTGAVLNGRALARTGAVTLLSNTIVRPAL